MKNKELVKAIRTMLLDNCIVYDKSELGANELLKVIQSLIEGHLMTNDFIERLPDYLR